MSKRFEELLVYHCAPALCGIKSSNLVSLSLSLFPNIEEYVRELNERYAPKREFKILRKTKKTCLVLVYTSKKLYNTIFSEENYQFLLKNNYPKEKEISSYLDVLSSKISNNKDFPHEIGVFLGYDLDDVIAFEEGRACLYSGDWKVYSDVEDKIQTFERFSKCKNNFLNLITQGYRLEQLLR